MPHINTVDFDHTVTAMEEAEHLLGLLLKNGIEDPRNEGEIEAAYDELEFAIAVLKEQSTTKDTSEPPGDLEALAEDLT